MSTAEAEVLPPIERDLPVAPTPEVADPVPADTPLAAAEAADAAQASPMPVQAEEAPAMPTEWAAQPTGQATESAAPVAVAAVDAAVVVASVPEALPEPVQVPEPVPQAIVLPPAIEALVLRAAPPAPEAEPPAEPVPAVPGTPPTAEQGAAVTPVAAGPVRRWQLPERLWAPLAKLARNQLFVWTVALPTLVSALYFGVIASDVYVSESKFVVRMPQRQQAPSLMGALMQGSGFMRSQDDTFTVHEYMLSRDALQALDDGRAIHSAFSAPAIDRLNRFPAPWSDDNFEALFRYYGQRVGVNFDAGTAITTLRVTAFTAQDAHAINAKLLDLSEALVNQVNNRGRGDLIRYAQNEVVQAEKRAKDAATAIAGYRQSRAVFDPERQSALQLQGAAKLQEELTAARAQLSQVEAAAPQNPQIPSLRLRVQQLEAALGASLAGITGGGQGSLTSKAADYERLVLERGFAERQLAGALSALDAARNEARRQQLYLERVVQPNLPDEAIEPRRLRGVAGTLLAGLVAWGVLTLLLSSVREHRN